MGLPKLWGKDSDGSRGFVFSHVKTIYYNWAQKKLLSTKLDEIDALIDQKIAKAMMSNVQVNDQNKVPTSALAYAMQQQITENEEAITVFNNDLIGRAIYATDLFADQETPIFVVWDAYTQNTPYKQGLTDSTFGFGLAGGHPDTFFTIFTCTIAKNELYMYSVSNGAPTGWEKIYPK